jgi:hypothetical protein
MSNMRSTMTAIILSVGFAAVGSAAVQAQDGSGRTTTLRAVHAHSGARIAGHSFRRPGYATYLAVDSWTTRPSLRFVPSGGSESCDLPSSACSNDQRITN